MADNVINLNRFRKKKAREQKEKQAEINRIRHGRTKAEKLRDFAEKQRADRTLDGKRLGEEAEVIALVSPESVIESNEPTE